MVSAWGRPPGCGPAAADDAALRRRRSRSRPPDWARPGRARARPAPAHGACGGCLVGLRSWHGQGSGVSYGFGAEIPLGTAGWQNARGSRVASLGVIRASGQIRPGKSRASVPFAAFQVADQVLEILGLAEILVDAGEAHIGDLVEAGQRLHHQFADHRGGDLVLAHAFQAAHDAGDHAVHPLGLDRALAQRMRDRAFQLVALEGLAAVVLLDDDQLAQLHALEGGEAAAAGRAMAAAADGRIVLAGTAVLHLAVVMSAERAAHGRLAP